MGRVRRGVLAGMMAGASLLVPLTAAIVTAPPAAAAPPANTSARTGVPANIYAIGDSITTATGTKELGQEWPAHSWVTGTHSTVQSMRHRLGISTSNAVNLAQNGKRMRDFDDQANQLPSTAAYVVVELGGNDLCRPSIGEMTSVADYRTQVRNGLAAVANRAPNALIFLASVPDIYNLWFLRGAPESVNPYVGDAPDQAGQARLYWDNGLVDIIPCKSLLENPTSTSAADENRRQQVRNRNLAFNDVLAQECAAVLRCRFDGHAFFNRSSNRANPPHGALLPRAQWWFTNPDISHNAGTWGWACPVNFAYDQCGDHFHPSLSGQAKLAQGAHEVSYQFLTDSTAPTRSTAVSRPPDGNGVYAGPVDVSFGGTDANGIRGQEVRVVPDGSTPGPWVQHIGLAPPVTISATGTTHVQVRSLDNNGNLSSSTTRTVTIDPGDVAGTVTDTDGPIAGVQVTLHGAAAEGVLATTSTGPDGTYTFPDVAENQVRVQAVDPTGAHEAEWYDDAESHATATDVAVVAGATASVDLDLAIVPGTVAGVVSGPSGPLEGVEVELHDASAAGAVASTTTAEDGTYDLEIDPGEYKVRFRDPTGDHLTEWFDDQSGHGPATPVVVTFDQTSTADAVLTLTPGAIGGTVSDAAGPVAGVTVGLHEAGTEGPVASTSTAWDGSYVFPLVVPGTYRVAFSDPSGAHEAEWHADAADHASATDVVVSKEQTSTVDAELTIIPGAVSGTVTGPSGPLEGITVDVHATGAEGVLETTTTDGDGTYDLDLVPGTYRIELTDPSGVHLGEWHQDAADHGTATDVVVTREQTTVDAALALTPGSIHGTVSGPDGPVEGLSVLAVASGQEAAGEPVDTDATGQYEITDLLPGAYTVTVAPVECAWLGTGAPAEVPTAGGSDTVDLEVQEEPPGDHGLDGVAAWVEEAVRWLVDDCNDPQYMTGLPDGSFGTDLDITRGQAVRALHRIHGEPELSDPIDHGFNDVPAWVEQAVDWAADNGLMTGYPDDTFRPNAPISRGQIARLLFRLEGEPDNAPDGWPPHGLTDVGAWIEESVRWLVAEGHATGVNGSFQQNAPITRGQFARMAYRVFA